MNHKLTLTNSLQTIFNELEQNRIELQNVDVNPIVKLLVQAKHIFVAGAGRSGVVITAFANRLMHLGFSVSIINEITKPKASNDDVLVLNSGSGCTESLITAAKKAKKLDMKVIVFTMNEGSPLALLADQVIILPKIEMSKQPMGSAYEQLSFIVFDALILLLMGELNQTNEMMANRHANIE
ncbi:6-phospho-3-hexuloisomerase [Orbaceae bacterium ac157xtp]